MSHECLVEQGVHYNFLLSVIVRISDLQLLTSRVQHSLIVLIQVLLISNVCHTHDPLSPVARMSVLLLRGMYHKQLIPSLLVSLPSLVIT